MATGVKLLDLPWHYSSIQSGVSLVIQLPQLSIHTSTTSFTSVIFHHNNTQKPNLYLAGRKAEVLNETL